MTADKIKQVMMRHFKLLKDFAGDSAAMLLRRHLPYYARYMGQEDTFGKAIRNIRTNKEFEESVRTWL